MNSLVIGLASIPSFYGDFERNYQQIAIQANKAHALGVSILFTPELSLSGYGLINVNQCAITPNNSYISNLFSLSKSLSLSISFGFIEYYDFAITDTTITNHKPFITQMTIHPDGSSYSYRKIHLGHRESQVFQPGTTYSLDSIPASYGIELCYDTHFPRLNQLASQKGALFMVAPFSSPLPEKKRSEIWHHYIATRAYDSRMYVACINSWSTHSSGGCILCSPNGNIELEDYSPSPTLYTYTLDLDLVTQYRNPNTSNYKKYYPAHEVSFTYL